MNSVAISAACLGKHPNNCKGDADKQARKKPYLSSYRCPFCGFWHVGHDAPASIKEKWRKKAKNLKRRASHG